MKKRMLVMFLVAVSACAALADSTFFDLVPVEDGVVDSSNTTSAVWNSRSVGRMGKTTDGVIYRPWLKFDLSQIPEGKNIASVQLILYGKNFATLNAFKVTTRHFNIYSCKTPLLSEAATIWGTNDFDIANPNECKVLQSGCEAIDSLGIVFSSPLMAENLKQAVMSRADYYALVIDEPASGGAAALEVYMRENFACQPILRIYTKKFIDIPASLDGTLDGNYPNLTTDWNAVNYFSRVGYDSTQLRTYKGWAKYDFSGLNLTMDEIESVSLVMPLIDLSILNEKPGVPLMVSDITNPEQLSNELTCWNNPPTINQLVAGYASYSYGDFGWASYIFDTQQLTDSVKAAIIADSEWGIVVEHNSAYSAWIQLQTLERGGSFVRIYLNSVTGDLNKDGMVDDLDLIMVAGNWLEDQIIELPDTIVDDFESYADQTALSVKWQEFYWAGFNGSSTSSTAVLLTNPADVYSGGKSLRWIYDANDISGNAQDYTDIVLALDSPIDLTNAKSVKMNINRHSGNSQEKLLYIKFFVGAIDVPHISGQGIWLERANGSTYSPTGWTQWTANLDELVGYDKSALGQVSAVLIGCWSPAADLTSGTGVIDIDNITVVYNDSCGGYLTTDLNKDCITDLLDMSIVAYNWLDQVVY